MDQITVRIQESTLEELEEEVDDSRLSRSEHIREVLESRHDHDEHDCVPIEEYQDLDSKHERLQTEVERVRDEKRKILAQREENQQLRKYAQQDKEWHEAALLQRLKWYVYGKD